MCKLYKNSGQNLCNLPLDSEKRHAAIVCVPSNKKTEWLAHSVLYHSLFYQRKWLNTPYPEFRPRGKQANPRPFHHIGAGYLASVFFYLRATVGCKAHFCWGTKCYLDVNLIRGFKFYHHTPRLCVSLIHLMNTLYSSYGKFTIGRLHEKLV